MKTPRVALSKLAEINPRLPIEAKRDLTLPVSFVPMSAVSADGYIIGEETRQIGDVLQGYTYFKRGDVLLAKITPCLENGKAAIADKLCREIGFGTTEFHVLRPKKGVYPRYLFHQVWNTRFRFFAKKLMKGAAGQKRVPVDFFDRYKVPFPQYDEQKHIATILDKADSIRRKRQQAIQFIDEFLRSMFLDMFGDLPAEAGKWPSTTVEKLLSKSPNAMRTGPFGSQLKHSEFISEGIPVLGIDNIVTNKFRWTSPRCLPKERYSELKRYRVFPNDVVVTIMGTTGRVAVTPKDLPECMSTKHLCVITLDKAKADPIFLWATLLFNQRVRNQAKVAGGGAIMEGWNMGIIKSLKFQLPPIELQRHFRSIAEQLEGQNNKFVQLQSLSNEAFKSISQKAFSGTL